MRADYDNEANAISITLVQGVHAQRADQRHPRAIVALRGDEPIELQPLYPNLGIDEPMRAVADPYRLDPEALTAAANAALAAPNRVVTLEVAVRSPV